MKCKHESQIHQLEAQNKELEEQLQKQQDECATCMQKLQQTERMLGEYELKIQKLEEQLQKQEDEMMQTYMYRRQSS